MGSVLARELIPFQLPAVETVIIPVDQQQDFIASSSYALLSYSPTKYTASFRTAREVAATVESMGTEVSSRRVSFTHTRRGKGYREDLKSPQKENVLVVARATDWWFSGHWP